MAPQDDLLKKLCGKDETFHAARALLRTAQAKTGPGSGYEVGPHSTGLPAICAYLASQQLCNNDISEVVAQTASCLKPKDFKKTLNIVRSVLGGPGLRDRNKLPTLTYDSLCRLYEVGVSSKVAAWALSVERTLLFSVKKGRYDPQSPLFRCAVFCWICMRQKLGQVSQASLIERYELAPRSFNSLLKVLDNVCDTLAKRIEADSRGDEPSLRKSSPTKSLHSRSPTKSPVKPSPVLTSQPSSPSKTPTRKRRVAFANDAAEEDENDVLPESPTKKRKLAIQKPAHVFPSTPTRPSRSRDPLDALRRDFDGDIGVEPESEMAVDPLPSPPGPSTPSRGRKPSTKVEVDGSAGAIEVDVAPLETRPSAQSRPRRFRRIFLDQKQWLGRDPRLEREWEQAEAHKKSMIALYGHPFEKYRSQMDL